ncbi:hypothetical protein IGI04_023304, partial [Brassica rapa subsp. trilocularis]
MSSEAYVGPTLAHMILVNRLRTYNECALLYERERRAEFQFVKVEDRGRGQDDCLKELEAQ